MLGASSAVADIFTYPLSANHYHFAVSIRNSGFATCNCLFEAAAGARLMLALALIPKLFRRGSGYRPEVTFPRFQSGKLQADLLKQTIVVARFTVPCNVD